MRWTEASFQMQRLLKRWNYQRRYRNLWQQLSVASLSTGTTVPPLKTTATEPTEHMFNMLHFGKVKVYPSREKIFQLLNTMKQPRIHKGRIAKGSFERIQSHRILFASEEEAGNKLEQAAVKELTYGQRGALIALVRPIFVQAYGQLGRKSAWKLVSLLENICSREGLAEENKIRCLAMDQCIAALWTESWKYNDSETLTFLMTLIKKKQQKRIVDFERYIQYHYRMQKYSAAPNLIRTTKDMEQVNQIQQLYWKLAEQFPQSSKLHTLYLSFCHNELSITQRKKEMHLVLSCDRFSFSCETFRVLLSSVSDKDQLIGYLKLANQRKLFRRPGFSILVVRAMFRLYDRAITQVERLRWLQLMQLYLECQLHKGISVPKDTVEEVMFELAKRRQVKASLHLFWFLKSCWLSIPDKRVLRILLLTTSRSPFPTCQLQVNEIWKLLICRNEANMADTKDQKLYIYACGMSKQVDKLLALRHSISNEKIELYMALIHALLWNHRKEEALVLLQQLETQFPYFSASLIGCFLLPPRSILWMLSNNEVRTLLESCYSVDLFLELLATHLCKGDFMFRRDIVHILVRFWYLLDSVGVHGMGDSSFHWMFSELEYFQRHEWYSHSENGRKEGYKGRMLDHSFVKLLVEKGIDELTSRLDMFACICKI
ncbi:hypothetical protein GpartN1_g7614.t1 [Galdieria partita]|uniref:Uncharacterized protein n=1 Tax=Galdieria partita TaxID=83374 RepID=A0A9C7Q3H3_9RHOD|nr:hypothetical protein GpartN1_g7614.t1 [Galdieria partita]